MGKVRDLSEQLFSGAVSTASVNPVTAMLGLEEYADGLAFISGFANVTAVSTEVGLLLIDTGAPFTGEVMRMQLRGWSSAPVHTAVYTHGHVDHALGIFAFDREASERKAPPIEVVSHVAVPARFARYKQTAGWNTHINARQFRIPGVAFPTEFREPDRVYDGRLDLKLGSLTVELRHARGETDDHTWVHLPEKRAICTGDLFIWAAPNCGNPQKVQRYPLEWARALRDMEALSPLVLFPGHGPPIEGRERVRTALLDSAALLEHLVNATLSLMNQGATLDEILEATRSDRVLAGLLERPFLRPVYDEPEFVVRNLYRLYGGWWDGNPARLKPPTEDRLAQEVSALAGGAAALLARAEAAQKSGDLALACQLAEWAGRAAPDDEKLQQRRAAIYRAREASETSLMARSIYAAAADRR